MENMASRYVIDSKTRNRALAAWFGGIAGYFAWVFYEYTEDLNRRGISLKDFPQLAVRSYR